MTHILIANQHGENRGDEAAMRAMLASFKKQVPDATFTLLYQYRDSDLRLSFNEPVEDLPIVLPKLDYLRGGLYTLFKSAGVDARWLLPVSLRRIIEAYDRADLVVSAPGGPYFGDIYANHEILHWWYVLLGRLFRKPLFLYATSAGPFKIAWLNLVRRWLYPKFDRLVTREELSAKYIEDLINAAGTVEVTADSAIQASFEPHPRPDWFTGERAALVERFLIAVSLNDFRYPDSKDPVESKRRYNTAMIETLSHLSARGDTHLLFLPQLYGQVHSDEPYLRFMAEQLPEGATWEIVESTLDSDTQRRLFAMCDLHIASRYHPAIFGNTAFVPGICIYYEHKALGFMQQLGLERYAFDINTVSSEPLRAAVDDIIAHREALIAHLHERVPILQQRSARTTRLAVELIEARAGA